LTNATVTFTAPTTPGTYNVRLFLNGSSTLLATSATITVTANTDTVPPTASITAPAAGATVSGTAVTISATAADNVGVAGVQFKLDGANFGAELITSPYTRVWNTTTTANGSHTVTAVA